MPPYGGLNRIRFEGYVSLPGPGLRTDLQGDPWLAAIFAEVWNNCKAVPVRHSTVTP